MEEVQINPPINVVQEEPIPEDQTQPEETVEETPAESERQISMSELLWAKLNEIHQQRQDAISAEDREKGLRLLRSPYDSLYFETAQDLENEVRAIREKTSKLSRTQRDALLQLQNYVIYDLSNAQDANNPSTESDEVQEESDSSATVAETVTEE